MLIIIWPMLKLALSVAFAVKLITSLTVIFVNDLFRVALTIGGVVSAITIKVLFCLVLPLVSVAYIVKLITQVSAQLIGVLLLICALVLDKPVKLTFVSTPE